MSNKFQTLAASKREATGTAVAKRLRRNKRVPAVIYGGHQDNYGVDLDLKSITDLLAKSATENVLVNLNIEGAKEQDKLVLIQAVQHHPLTSSVMHVDFRAVREDDTIVASVPVNLVGDCEGVHLGGLLDHQLHSIDIRCLPKDLPEGLDVDVTDLNIGDAAHVGDIKWPEGVEPVLGRDVVVAIVSEIRVAVIEEEEAPEAEETGEEAEAAAGEEAKPEG